MTKDVLWEGFLFSERVDSLIVHGLSMSVVFSIMVLY